MTFKLRDYQIQAADAVLEQFKAKEIQRTLGVLCTGGGKNAIASSLIERWLPHRSLFIADRDELCTQPQGAIKTITGMEPGLEKARSYCDDNDQVVVASIQTLNSKLCKGSSKRRLERFDPKEFTRVICDEAHLSMAPTWQRVIGYFDAKVLGLTATPYRSDDKSLGETYQSYAFEKHYPEMVSKGWLVPPKHLQLDIEIDLNAIPNARREATKEIENEELSHAIDPYLDKIADELYFKAGGRSILAFLPLVATAEKFARKCRLAGLRSTHSWGGDPDRAAKLDAFAGGKLDVLANAQLWTTGVDVPRCDAILCLRPIFSTTLYHQINGRGYRALPGVLHDGLTSDEERKAAIAASGKPDCLLIDPLWLIERHGLVGPGAILAANAEAAEEMTKKIQAMAGQVDLEIIHADFQAKREQELLDALQNAKRPDGLVDIMEYAASRHIQKVMDFIPITKLEHMPLNEVDKRILRKHKIDPDSVKTRGMFNTIYPILGQARYWGQVMETIIRENPE